VTTDNVKEEYQQHALAQMVLTVPNYEDQENREYCEPPDFEQVVDCLELLALVGPGNDNYEVPVTISKKDELVNFCF